MYTVEFIAKMVGGRVVGNGGAEVDSISPIDDVSEGSVVLLRNRDKIQLLEGNKGPLCVVTGFEPDAVWPFDFVVVEPSGLDAAFIKLLSLFAKEDTFPWGITRVLSQSPDAPLSMETTSPGKISPKARTPEATISSLAAVSRRATIGEGVKIADFAVVGDDTTVEDGTRIGTNVSIGNNCAIGKRCVIHPNVTIYPNTIIGDDVILHAGVVLGGDGFGYSSIDGKNRKIPQIGGVKIGRNVEIGANTTVDRATLGYTVIGENTKIDNLVQIAHNVVIGKNSIVCGLCGISGSVKIGDNVLMAGAVGIADHVVIEDGVLIGAKSGVMDKVVVKGRKLLGTPAINFKTEMEFIALKPKIKSMFFDLKKIKEKLGL